VEKNTPAFVSGIITFSEEAQEKIVNVLKEYDGVKKILITPFRDKVVEEVSIERLDELAIKFIREFEKRYGVKAVYLVRHLDETAPHYHFLFENLRDNGKMLSNTFVKPSVIQKGKARPYQQNVQEIQDLAGEIFSEVGIMRGETKEQRIARGEREYIKDLRKFKDIMQREEENLYREVRKLRAKVMELKPQVAALTKKKQDLEERIKEYELAKNSCQEEIERLWKELKEKEQLLMAYERKLKYYEENWEQLVKESLRRGYELQLEEERRRYRELNEKFEKLKEFIEWEYGKYKVEDVLRGDFGRGRGMSR